MRKKYPQKPLTVAQKARKSELKKVRDATPKCRAAARASREKYKLTHREADIASHRLYLDTHREKIRNYRVAYCAAHKKEIHERYEKQASKKVTRDSPDQVFAMVMKAIPRGLPWHVRDDMSGSMCLALLEGKLKVKEIGKKVAEYLKAHNREYDGFTTLSLDAPIPGGSGKTYMDRLAERPA